ncbi:MAG: phosphatase PAP2 family protein [Candidatus Heimdallarchaeaceae archaeon]
MAELFQRMDEWDKKISKKMGETSPKMLTVASFFALSGNAQPWILISVLFLMFDIFFKDQSDNLFQLIIIGLGGLTSTIIKYITKRKRPDEEVALKYIATGDHYSFPSGHATRMGITALFMMLYYPAFGWIFALWAFGVCYGRIALQIHYFLDIIGGTILGLIFGAVTYFLMDYLDVILDPVTNWLTSLW